MKIVNLKSKSEKSKKPTTVSKLTITDLKSGARDQNRVNIFVDSEFAFSLDVAQVVDFHLKVGKKLTKKEIKELEAASEYGKLYNQTLEWVLTRPHSVKETRDHLNQKLKKREYDNKLRKENQKRAKSDAEFKARAKKYKIPTKERNLFTKDDIEKVIDTLTEKKYLNDRRFAEWYIENRLVKKGASKKRLSQELYKKGIEKELIEELLEKSSRTDEAEIRKYIIKKGRKLPKEKLLLRLVSRGFPYDLSKDMIEAYHNCPEEMRGKDIF